MERPLSRKTGMRTRVVAVTRWFALMAMACTAVPAAWSADSVYFQHHDWLLACDNTRTCRAAGYAVDDGSTVSVLLERAAGPGTPVTARVSLEPTDEQSAAQAPLYLHLKQLDAGRLGNPDAGGHYPLSAAQTRQLLAVLARGGQVDIADSGDTLWTVSDRGAAAVLLKMDEFQGRLGTPGALMRKGTRAEADVLPALPVPHLQRAATLDPPGPGTPHADSPRLRAALRSTLGERDCWALQDPDSGTDSSPMTLVRIDRDHVVASLACWHGAYNAGEGYWLIADAAPWAPQLITLDANSFAYGEISASHKGRGLGDCWSRSSWIWDGTRFVLAYEGTTGLCRSVPGGTWELPTHVTTVREP